MTSYSMYSNGVAGYTYGPKHGKRLQLFIDDLHLPLRHSPSAVCTSHEVCHTCTHLAHLAHTHTSDTHICTPHTHIHAHHTHTCTHTLKYTLSNKYTHIHMHTHQHHTHTHTHAHTYTPQTHTHMHTHNLKQIHTHAHTRTVTCTHTQIPDYVHVCSIPSVPATADGQQRALQPSEAQ